MVGGEVGAGFGPGDAAAMVAATRAAVGPTLGGAMLWDFRSIALGFNRAHTNASEWGAAVAGALAPAGGA